jgi:hypothetical protein
MRFSTAVSRRSIAASSCSKAFITRDIAVVSGR